MAAKPAKTTARSSLSKSAPGLSIVVPLFNEAKGLAGLHERIAEVAFAAFGQTYNVAPLRALRA